MIHALCTETKGRCAPELAQRLARSSACSLPLRVQRGLHCRLQRPPLSAHPTYTYTWDWNWPPRMSGPAESAVGWSAEGHTHSPRCPPPSPGMAT